MFGLVNTFHSLLWALLGFCFGFFFFFFFFSGHAAWHVRSKLPTRYGTMPPAVEDQILNHWTAREVPGSSGFGFHISSG